MKPIIRVENLGKQYQIGRREASYATLRESLVGAARAPFDRLRRRFRREVKGDAASDRFWALRDVSFEVMPGEVVGIIGRNGAGKSTLLKILSRVTEPTEGRVDLYGRVGSLLEVGTGFHPELTGRENVYLNGAILGMKRREIGREFDSIVGFAEIERFLDTPVKRYSSGMFVRLAFAVAAHLQTEILVVDEVLAVGDAKFQKRCLGKMGEVASKGRTVFFVSHNLPAIVALTKRCLVVKAGRVEQDGPTHLVAASYALAARGKQPGAYRSTQACGRGRDYVESAQVVTSEEDGRHLWGRKIVFEFVINIERQREALCFSFQVLDHLERPVCHFWLFDPETPIRRGKGRYVCRCEVGRLRLFLGSYSLTTWLSDRRADSILESLSGICPFDVAMDGITRPEYEWRVGDCVYLEEASWGVERKQ